MTELAFIANCQAEPASSARSQRLDGAWGEVRPSASIGATGGRTSGKFAGRNDIEQCSAGDPGGGAL